MMKELNYLLKNRPENCERCNENNESFNLNLNDGFTNFFYRLNAMIVYFLNVLNVSSSMYLQFSFHIFLLMVIFLIGIFLSLFNVIYDEEIHPQTNDKCKNLSENQLLHANGNKNSRLEPEGSNFIPVRCLSKKFR